MRSTKSFAVASAARASSGAGSANATMSPAATARREIVFRVIGKILIPCASLVRRATIEVHTAVMRKGCECAAHQQAFRAPPRPIASAKRRAGADYDPAKTGGCHDGEVARSDRCRDEIVRPGGRARGRRRRDGATLGGRGGAALPGRSVLAKTAAG